MVDGEWFLMGSSAKLCLTKLGKILHWFICATILIQVFESTAGFFLCDLTDFPDVISVTFLEKWLSEMASGLSARRIHLLILRNIPYLIDS